MLCFCHAYMEEEELQTRESFWAGVRRVTHSSVFKFDTLLKQSYGFNGRKYKSRRSFPRRKFIQKVMRWNEQWAEQYTTNHILNYSSRPLGFVQKDIPIVLAKNASERLSLAEFLPFAYKATKLDVIYSTDVHGRSLELFYNRCARAKHTVTLIEILNSDTVVGK